MALEKVLRPLASTLVRKIGERASVGKPFYSPIDQAIANITQGTGTGQQMLAELLKTKGVAKELKDRPAIKKALEAAKDTKVTKADVERVAAENPTPQVQHRESDTTEYEQWQMPGGENRRNILLRLPNPAAERNAQIAAQIRDLYQGIGWSNQHMAKFPHLSVDEIPRIAHSEQEIAKLRKELAALPRTPDMYEGGHFDEKNILAHARVADYYDNNGKKILLIDEIQSDWHQAARDARKNEIKRLMKAEGIDKATANARVPKEFGYAMPETQRLKGVAQPDDQGGYKVVWEDGTFSGGYSKESAEAKALEGKSNATSGVVPDAPFKQNWHELVMKRLLDDAARNGYDKVVITPGAEQAKRYDLSKHVDSIVWERDPDGRITFTPTKNGQELSGPQTVDQNELSEHLGKEVAEKITSNPKDNGNLSNIDLQVGGEGMTGFYDQIIPSFLNDYGKKYGVTVGTHDLLVPRKNPLRRIQDAVDEGHITAEEVSAMNQPQRNAFMDQFQTRVNPVHSFDITPQMREEITTKGQPLYQVAPPVAIGAGAAMQEEEPTEYAGGGIIKKAGQIIGKAAQSSGMARPVTATKDLTTLQDIHTSLGDRIRENALEAQKQMESFDYKYDKGQRVFTQDSAAKNKPPYTILGRTRVGNRPMTEDGTIMGKKIIDPETGKTKRTPYEPGYRVRYENGDDWSEFDIPATAIMGDVEMAGGGAVRKALKALFKAPQDEALRLAQQRAALPVERGGLGLPKNNTAEQRAAAMGFDANDNYVHNTSIPFDRIEKDTKFSGIFTLPNRSANYGNVDMPLVVRGKIATSRDLQDAIKNPTKKMQRAIDETIPENVDIADATVEMQKLRNELARKYGFSGINVEDEFGGRTVALVNPDNIRSRFAAFDPFRRNAATAAAMGVAAPDLLAEEKKAKGGQVSKDAMWIALQNKQLRKKHGN